MVLSLLLLLLLLQACGHALQINRIGSLSSPYSEMRRSARSALDEDDLVLILKDWSRRFLSVSNSWSEWVDESLDVESALILLMNGVRRCRFCFLV